LKVLVIGSNGFLGRHLCAGFAASGIAVTRSSTTDGSGMDPNSGLLPADYTVAPDTDAVVYLAQSPHTSHVPEKADHLLAVNVVSAVRAAELARIAGVRRFVYASTGTVYGPSFAPLRETDPLRRDNWYALSKIQAEEALALFGNAMEVTSVRIFGLYGPGQTGRLIPNLIRSVAESRPVTLARRHDSQEPDGGLRISLLHVSDAVAALRVLLDQTGLPVVNLASDEAPSIREIAETIGEHLCVTPVFQDAPHARPGDLIADISLLRRAVRLPFIRLRAGLTGIVAASPGRIGADVPVCVSPGADGARHA